MKFRTAILVLLLAIPAAGAQQPITLERIGALKSAPCVLFHVWASWCSICIEEMPRILPFLKQQKKVHSIIIDISDPMAQEKFSEEWMEKLKPPFPIYKRGKGSEEKFRTALDPSWKGSLPFSVLYHKGKIVKAWTGSFPFSSFPQAVNASCR